MPDWEYHGLCPELLRAVQSEGWDLPTPIQDEALPAILGGGDVCGAAETGSGKTAAFCLPILQNVQEELVNSGSMLINDSSKSSSKSSSSSKSNDATTSDSSKSSSSSSVSSSGCSILLSMDDRDSMLAVSSDQLCCQSRGERQWMGVRATVGATSGAKVCYEATVDDEGLCRVGWSTAAAKYDVGTDSQSWGFGGTGMKSHKKKFEKYGRPFGQGDVIGCYLDMCDGRVFFTLNGESCGGDAYSNITTSSTTVMFPSCVLKNAQMKFNFNTMKYSLPISMGVGFIPIGQAKASMLRAGGSTRSTSGSSSGSSSSSSSSSSSGGACRAIIIAPTRDLAAQIHRWVNKLSKFITNPCIKSALVIGGGDDQQKMSEISTAHIIIGTCGKLIDMIQRNKIHTNNIRFFVLDEADQLANDKESLKIVKEIHSRLIQTTVNHSARLQVCFFSATLHSDSVRRLAEQVRDRKFYLLNFLFFDESNGNPSTYMCLYNFFYFPWTLFSISDDVTRYMG